MTDELAGTWMFNDIIDYTSFVSITQETLILFNFTSNGNTYFGITTDFKPNGLFYTKSSNLDDFESVYVASTNTWTNEAYKTIIITSKLSEVLNGDALLAWLQANATKQAPTVVRKSIDLTTLSGWSSLSSGSHNITIVAKAENYRDSEPSAAVSVTKSPAVTLINFTIAGTSYQAEEGMTWEEWVNSDYNTGGYVILDNLVYKASGRHYFVYDDVTKSDVQATDTIVSSRAYVHNTGASG